MQGNAKSDEQEEEAEEEEEEEEEDAPKEGAELAMQMILFPLTLPAKIYASLNTPTFVRVGLVLSVGLLLTVFFLGVRTIGKPTAGLVTLVFSVTIPSHYGPSWTLGDATSPLSPPFSGLGNNVTFDPSSMEEISERPIVLLFSSCPHLKKPDFSLSTGKYFQANNVRLNAVEKSLSEATSAVDSLRQELRDQKSFTDTGVSEIRSTLRQHTEVSLLLHLHLFLMTVF